MVATGKSRCHQGPVRCARQRTAVVCGSKSHQAPEGPPSPQVPSSGRSSTCAAAAAAGCPPPTYIPTTTPTCLTAVLHLPCLVAHSSDTITNSRVAARPFSCDPALLCARSPPPPPPPSHGPSAGAHPQPSRSQQPIPATRHFNTLPAWRCSPIQIRYCILFLAHSPPARPPPPTSSGHHKPPHYTATLCTHLKTRRSPKRSALPFARRGCGLSADSRRPPCGFLNVLPRRRRNGAHPQPLARQMAEWRTACGVPRLAGWPWCSTAPLCGLVVMAM